MVSTNTLERWGFTGRNDVEDTIAHRDALLAAINEIAEACEAPIPEDWLRRRILDAVELAETIEAIVSNDGEDR